MDCQLFIESSTSEFVEKVFASSQPLIPGETKISVGGASLVFISCESGPTPLSNTVIHLELATEHERDIAPLATFLTSKIRGSSVNLVQVNSEDVSHKSNLIFELTLALRRALSVVQCYKKMSFDKFLEETPPGEPVLISTLSLTKDSDKRITNRVIRTPQIWLFCTHSKCLGKRRFSTQGLEDVRRNELNTINQIYTCQNCNTEKKEFAIRARFDIAFDIWVVSKYGEYPNFGDPTPPKLFKLIGSDRKLFTIGRKAESQSMGIGAYAYYRRVIENQKNRIFDEIIRVLEKTHSGDPIIDEIKTAKAKTQFTSAVDEIKHGLPDSLMIQGHNPLTLLHQALSQGLHDRSDSECLEIAGNLREVLFAFAEKLDSALKDDKKLTEAVSALASFKQGPPQ